MQKGIKKDEKVLPLVCTLEWAMLGSSEYPGSLAGGEPYLQWSQTEPWFSSVPPELREVGSFRPESEARDLSKLYRPIPPLPASFFSQSLSLCFSSPFLLLFFRPPLPPPAVASGK